MIMVNEISNCPGIYELDGKLNYTMNLQKKSKKVKGNFKVIKEMPNATLKELCKEIDNNVQDDNEDDNEDERIILHHYFNKDTGYNITSIFDNMKINGYEQID